MFVILIKKQKNNDCLIKLINALQLITLVFKELVVENTAGAYQNRPDTSDVRPDKICRGYVGVFQFG